MEQRTRVATASLPVTNYRSNGRDEKNIEAIWAKIVAKRGSADRNRLPIFIEPEAFLRSLASVSQQVKAGCIFPVQARWLLSQLVGGQGVVSPPPLHRVTTPAPTPYSAAC
jgi:hypothetical protein